MPWQNQGGGPWGGSGGNGGGGPWGRGPSGGGSGGPQPPDIEDLLRRGQDRMRSILPGGGGVKGIALIVLAAAGIWLGSGFYRVQPDQQGVVLTFGRWTSTTAPGLNWAWPSPIQSVITPSVTRENRIEVGLRSGADARGGVRDVPDESQMLTGDENIVDIDFTVLWRIKDAGQFLFGVRDPEGLVKVSAESAMRESVGKTPIQQAFTEGRGKLEADTLINLQKALDSYGTGVEVTQVQLLAVDPPAPVVDAFNEVQRARADRERLRNEAEAYRNDVIPRARGESEQLLQEAQAYREEVVNRALGDAKRFSSVFAAYRLAPDVTAERMYLEAIEDVLRNANKIVIDSNAAGSGVVPYLPLNDLKIRPAAQPAAQPPRTNTGKAQ